MIPPTGNAIIGSITISAIGRKANNKIVTIGPNKLRHNVGNCSSFSSCRSPSINSPLGIRGIITNTVTSNPTIAGSTPAAITEDRGASKFSAAIMVFGLGDRILPHLPPPIIAIRSLNLESFKRLPMMIAIGAIVMTATSMKTPIAVNNSADNANAR